MPLFEGNEEVAHNKELASKKFFVYNLEHCNSIFILQIRTMTYEKKMMINNVYEFGKVS